MVCLKPHPRSLSGERGGADRERVVNGLFKASHLERDCGCPSYRHAPTLNGLFHTLAVWRRGEGGVGTADKWREQLGHPHANRKELEHAEYVMLSQEG